MCTLIMVLALFLMDKINLALGLSNTIYTISAIIIAVIVYVIAVFTLNVLNEKEIHLMETKYVK